MAKDTTRLTSPSGVARWPRLNQPDTKFNDKGEYKVDLVIPSSEAKTFVKTVSDIQKAAAGKAKLNMGWVKKETDDQGNETGNVIIRFKAKNVVLKDGSLWDRKPTIFDTAGRRITDNVGGGSQIKVACDVYSVTVNGTNFVQLQPVAVRVENLVEYTGGHDAADFGFEVEKTDEVAVPTEGQDEDLF